MNDSFGKKVKKTAQEAAKNEEHQFDFANLLTISGDKSKLRKAEEDAFQLYEAAYRAIFLPSERESFIELVEQLRAEGKNPSSESQKLITGDDNNG